MSLYPWQLNAWQQLNKDKQRMPHALLFHGRAGTGKLSFAQHLSQSLLCSAPNENQEACGVCASCHWFLEESHPDFKVLTPEQDGEPEEGAPAKKLKKKTQISVTQIRELSQFLNMTSHQQGGLRIILVQPAESLNTASANALLKMLEEPAAGVLFILVSHQIERLLPTILSRCQKIALPLPAEAESLAWLNGQGILNAAEQLAYYDSSPLKVLQEQGQYPQIKGLWQMLAMGAKLNPYTAATGLLSSFSSVNLPPAYAVEASITALQKWIYDILASKLTRNVRYHPQHTKTFQALAENVNLSLIFSMQKELLELRKLASHPLNHELQIERLLFDYTKLFKG